MSHHFDAPLSTQSDWQGQQYSYLPPGDSSIYSQSYEHGQAPHNSAGSQAQPRSATDANGAMDIDTKSERNTLSPQLTQRRSEDQSGLRTQKQLSPNAEHPVEGQGDMDAAKAAAESTKEGSVTSAGTTAMSMGSNAMSSASSAGQSSDMGPIRADDHVKQEDDDDLLDDDDMDGEGDGITAEMTPAERTAARRKMKRFRYIFFILSICNTCSKQLTPS